MNSFLALAQTPVKQKPFDCNSGKSYLFQGNPTDVYEIDILAGTTTRITTGGLLKDTTGLSGKLNAFGYNPKDSLIYGSINNTTKLVRIGSDYSTQIFTVNNATSGNFGTSFVVGDIDKNGKMYLTRGGAIVQGNANTNIRIVDLNAALGPSASTALPFTSLVSNSTAGLISDWAASPIDNNLYTIDGSGKNNASGAALVMYRFNTTTGVRQILGTVSGGSTAIVPGTFGAVFMDVKGTMYVVNNDNGYIHSIARPDTMTLTGGRSQVTYIPATYVITGPKAGLYNDGARCALSLLKGSAPLPVTLVSFTAAAAPSRRVQLNWATASELNSSYFEVQHSFDGNAFTVIGQVTGKGITSQLSSYSFVDVAPGTAAKHYYRLRQVDQDGRSAFSPVQAVTLAPGSSLVQLTAIPNPTSGNQLSLQVQYEGSAATSAVLTVHGLLGQTVSTQSIILKPGTTTFTLPTQLTPGVYWLALRGDSTLGTQSTKVLVTN